ncbi:MAG TPA: flagellar export chaperone FliS [Bacillota bacterium]|nr:flagellar export chaperone FliS [Bacillota bacterium]
MSKTNPYQAYQRQAVTTSKPEELTLMLYEGIVKFVRLSKMALDKQQFEEAHRNNLRAQDIISELIVTLKKEYEVSESLLPLYEYMKTRLIEANINKSVSLLEEVEGYAVEFAETWSTAMKSVRT